MSEQVERSGAEADLHNALLEINSDWSDWDEFAALKRVLQIAEDALRGRPDYPLRAARLPERPDGRTHFLIPGAEDAGHESATACGVLPLAEPSSDPATVDCLDCLRLLAAAARLPERPDEGITDAMVEAAVRRAVTELADIQAPGAMPQVLARRVADLLAGRDPNAEPVATSGVGWPD